MSLPHRDADFIQPMECLSRALEDSLRRLPDYVCIETSDAVAAFRDESMVGKSKVLRS